MRVTILVDLRDPPQWRRDWVEHYHRTIEFIEEAERLGIDCVKFSEHHLFEDGLLSQPLTMAAAVATRTSKIRIMAGVLAPLIHPQRLAEEAGIIDVLSRGRLEVALGAGYRVPEFEAYGVPYDRRFKALASCVDAVRSIWGSGTTLPMPVQRPLPLWLMADGAIAAKRAGRKGAGLLSMKPELYEPYMAGLAEAGLGREHARIEGIVRMTFATDPDAAWPAMSRYMAYREDSIDAGRVAGTAQPAPDPVEARGSAVHRPGEAEAAARLVTPEAGAEEILASVGDRAVTGVQFFLSVAGMPDDLVAENLRLIATRVRPLLQRS